MTTLVNRHAPHPGPRRTVGVLGLVLTVVLPIALTAPPAEATPKVKPRQQQHVKQAPKAHPHRALTAFAAPHAIGPALFVAPKKVKKQLLSASQAKSLSASTLVATLRATKTRTGKNTYGNKETKRFFRAGLYGIASRSGAVPNTIAVVQLGSRYWAGQELLAYKADKSRTGGKNYGVTSTSVTHVYRKGGRRLAQTATKTGSAVIVSVCARDSKHKASVKQLNKCAQRLAYTQRKRAAALFTKAPQDYPWLRAGNTTVSSYTPYVISDSNAACAPTVPSDPTTRWCGVILSTNASGSVAPDQLVGLTAAVGTATQTVSDGKLAIFYTPAHDGPYQDTISYRVTNSRYGVTSPGVTTITVTVGQNGNYTLSTASATRFINVLKSRTTAAPTCTDAWNDPNSPGWEWCPAFTDLTDAGLISWTSGLYYDTITATSKNGYGTVTTEVVGGHQYIWYQPRYNGPFTDEVTFQLSNNTLHIASNVSTITINVAANSNY